MGEPDIAVGLVGDRGLPPEGIAHLVAALSSVEGRLTVECAEVSVAMRCHDPLPGLRAVFDVETAVRAGGHRIAFYPEVPLTGGVLASLDLMAGMRSRGALIAPKFRVGGLASELFPTPVELAAVICACRDRDLPFKVTSNGYRAVRRTDPETGLVNHGLLNILAAVLRAGSNGEPADIVELLATTDLPPLTEIITEGLGKPRPLWHGMSCYGDVDESVNDLRVVGLLPA